MFQSAVTRCVLALVLMLGAALNARAADDGIWTVSKSSGEAWIVSSGPQPASLKQEDTLKPGDTIRTGRNGRVLLVRGEETILISPNSVIGLPAEKKDGLATTIVQRAGSILLEVEKQNVKHFEVETPYLAAVVKGTQFSVTVAAAATSVHVRRGQVEVSDFRTGQIAQVLPGQAATSFVHGKGGLSLSGSGTFNPIEQGKPRATSVERVPVPRSGLSAPGNVKGDVIHALNRGGTGPVDRVSGQASGQRSGVRISAAIGEVRLNFHTITHGLAHGANAFGSAKNSKDDSTIWSDAKASAAGGPGLSQSNVSAAGNASSGGGAGAAASSSGVASGVASTVAAVTGAASQGGSAIGNGANGNGNSANANGNNGNGNNGNGNGHNGNGNGGVGNGNGKGNAKH